MCYVRVLFGVCVGVFFFINSSVKEYLPKIYCIFAQFLSVGNARKDLRLVTSVRNNGAFTCNKVLMTEQSSGS